MKGLLVIWIFTSGFAQINWKIEIVDSFSNGYEYLQSLAIGVDSSDAPHIVYNIPVYNNSKIIYASRIDTIWQKEIVESGLFYYGFSLIFDYNNIPHLSYYRLDGAVDKTYLCHAWKSNTSWQIEAVDSITGDFEGWINWIIYRKTSIDLDTSGLPGIAYSSRNIVDSITYNKFAHYNGTSWDTSIIEYDSAYANVQERPTDFSPSLDFSSTNVPYVAFQQIIDPAQYYDTLKLAYYDDILKQWIVEPILNNLSSWFMVSLKLNKSDYPRIAHNMSGCLCFAWWDGVSWRTEEITLIGWYHTKYHLQLDSLDNSHILYLPDPMVGHPCYCYKENNTWHLCGWVEPDSTTLTTADISFSLDKKDQPYVSYQFDVNNGLGVKYARGTFVGIGEEQIKKPLISFLEISPNPFYEEVKIKFSIEPKAEGIELKIYDVNGRLVKDFPLSTPYSQFPTVVSWDGRDNTGHKVSSGIYFIQLNTADFRKTKKVILLR